MWSEVLFFWRRLEGAWVAWILRPGFMVVSATLTVVSSRENSVPDPDYLIAAYGKSRRTELEIFGFYKQQYLSYCSLRNRLELSFALSRVQNARNCSVVLCSSLSLLFFWESGGSKGKE